MTPEEEYELLSLEKKKAASITPEQPNTIVDSASHLARLGGHMLASGALGPSVMLGEGLNQVYNLGAKGINAVAGTNIEPRSSVSSGFQTFLSNAGLEPPANATERFVHAAGSALTGVGTQLGLVNAAKTGTSIASDLVRNTLLQQPIRQGVAAVTGATAGQATAEAGGGPVSQFLASMAGGIAPFAKQIAFPTSPATKPNLDLIKNAQGVGYKIPPSQMGSGFGSRAVEGLSGKGQMAQEVSVNNQNITDKIARVALKVSEDTPIDKTTIATRKLEAGQGFEALKNVGPISIDDTFTQAVKDLGGKGYLALKRDFPEMIRGDIEKLQSSLNTTSPTTEGVMEAIKELRYKASQNFRMVDASGNPTQRGLAAAQKESATLLEDLIDRNLTKTGQKDILDRFRVARQDYAIASTIEDAMDARGHVIAKDLDPRAPLSPGLRLASDFSRSFGRANQNIDKAASATPFTSYDLFHAGLFGYGGHQFSPAYGALAAAIPVARPLARYALESPLGQYLASPPSSILTSPQAGTLATLAGIRANQP